MDYYQLLRNRNRFQNGFSVGLIERIQLLVRNFDCSRIVLVINGGPPITMNDFEKTFSALKRIFQQCTGKSAFCARSIDRKSLAPHSVTVSVFRFQILQFLQILLHDVR